MSHLWHCEMHSDLVFFRSMHFILVLRWWLSSHFSFSYKIWYQSCYINPESSRCKELFYFTGAKSFHLAISRQPPKRSVSWCHALTSRIQQSASGFWRKSSESVLSYCIFSRYEYNCRYCNAAKFSCSPIAVAVRVLVFLFIWFNNCRFKVLINSLIFELDFCSNQLFIIQLYIRTM